VKYRALATLATTTLIAANVFIQAGCSVHGSTDPNAGAPPPATVEHENDGSVLRVEHPDQFPVVAATSHAAVPELTVTGVVTPDVSRAVPVISLASGRVVDLRVRLGDQVKRGQLLLRIESADASAAVGDYKKAKTDAVLAQSQLERSQELFGRGAIAKKDLEVAQDTADKAKVDLEDADARLRVLGIDSESGMAGVVDVVAPASGVITEQNVTNAAGVKTLDNSPNLLTISDLSHVWIVCDVYENDLPAVHVGDSADIHLAAYPDEKVTGRIDDIGPILDPNLHTAKVRIEVQNPGTFRIGMFVTAAFHGRSTDIRPVVPATAVLHLHDRDWVYVPNGDGTFRRQEVRGGQMLGGGTQELLSGLQPGDRVVSNALVFQNTVEQ
jgi:cobalt-zinc-cadmium efflux system membrane fusion protein